MELIYYSTKISLEIKNYQKLIANISNWTISDEYIPNTNKNLGTYQFILKSKDIISKEELTELLQEGNTIAKRIIFLIIYIIGHPLDYKSNHFYGQKKYFEIIGKPINCWENNYEVVKDSFETNDEKKIKIKFEIGGMNSWSIIENSPLVEMSQMLKIYPSLDDLTKLLIRYHYNALKNETDVRYVLLGKALEIVEILLPRERNKQKRFNLLPEELRQIFGNKTLSWLFEMSNYRLETRHAINKKSDSLLHKEMTDEEYFNFLYISENLISYVIRTKFNLELNIMRLE